MNVGIILNSGNITGGGGAERFFANFSHLYNNYSNKEHNVKLITDNESYLNLIEVGLPVKSVNTIIYKNQNNRFKTYLENTQLLYILVKHNIKLIQYANFQKSNINQLKFLKKLPSLIKPKTVLTIVDCQIVHYLQDKKHENHIYSQERFMKPLKEKLFDGVYTWYENTEKYLCHIFNKQLPIQSIKSRFINTPNNLNLSNKKNEIIFAARLSKQKNPDWLVKAIYKIKNECPELINNWSFSLYGKGPEKENLKKLILKLDIGKYITLKESGTLLHVFQYSKCFISTQDYENFPSLSMMEAMACGNAIIARNVGQTDLLVKNNVNGYLLDEDSTEGLKNKICQFINESEKHEQFKNESIKLIKEVHTFENFVIPIENFWLKVLNKSTS